MAEQHIEKPWGSETCLEVNDQYVLKLITIKKGHKCSLQYHEKKRETIFVVCGKLYVYIGDSEDDLKRIVLPARWSMTIEPGKIHRMEADPYGDIDETEYLEASTPELDDVIRVQDDYDRKTGD